MRNKTNLGLSEAQTDGSGLLPRLRLERSQQQIDAAEMANMKRMATKIAAYQSVKLMRELIAVTRRQAEAAEHLNATLQSRNGGA